MTRVQADDPLLTRAEALLRAGRPDEAAAACRAVLAARPGHAGAWHRLGLADLQAGRADAGRESLARAAALAPRDAAVHHDLGHALAMLGRFAEAAATWEEAGRIAPRMASAHANRGTALALLGRFADAASAFRAALRADPNHRDAWLGHADSLLRAGQAAEALSALDRARVRVGPDADFDVVRALALRATGDLPAAARLLDEIVASAPENAVAWGALGLARLDRGDDAGAADALARAEALDPALAETPFNLASAERRRDRLGAALAALDRAIERRPGFAAAHLHRGHVLVEQGRPVEADAAFAAVLALHPGHPSAESARLFALNYRDDLAPAAVAAAHREWGRGTAEAAPARPAVADRDPGRRLRVGYVSADFHTHSVAYFALPLLASHDRGAVEVVGYADVAAGDAMTDRLRAACDHWRPIHGMDDEAVAAMVRDDGIDVLVDLGGHTAHNRLGMFARRPAPLQGTWLGYPNSTGLAAIDFRITDAIADPPGEADLHHVERLVRLPRPFLCYAPSEGAGAIAAAGGGRPVTFGSFNALAKMSPATVAAWARLVTAVPDARLLLKARGLDDGETATLWRDRFAAAGLDPARLVLLGRVASTAGHLAAYGEVDVALDPFPYNGTTTTMEALSTGVPVVTLEGDRHAGRVGAAILRPLGLDRLVAGDVGAYVDAAVQLARDEDGRRRLAGTLPDLLADSPLCDAAAFANAMEAAYRAEWRRLLM